MKKFCIAAVLIIALSGARAEEPPRIVHPFERVDVAGEQGLIDRIVNAALKQKGIQPAPLCSDEVFLRRVYVDVIGTLPTSQEANRFYQDKNPGKRSALIEELLNREEFADYQALKWGDVLRVKAEFPINLWPNGVQAYHRWIRDAIRQNKPYDEFARELLTSSGSNFRTPPVNFYRAIQGREPSAIAGAAALTFMGSRSDAWPEDRRLGFEAFFSRVAYKSTAEWKEEIVHVNPAPTEPFKASFPDGREVVICPGQDPRRVFADWLVTKENPWFAKNMANRVWAWLMGRGVIHEPDDIRPDNPPSNPELLACLEKELTENHFDLKHLYRIILNSKTYQQSSIPRSNHPDAEALFAFYPVRRLDAEVLIDALNGIMGSRENYYSEIPEPFTYVPETDRTITLSDGSITSDFLEKFGRPARDTGRESERNNQPTETQRLYLLNSAEIHDRIGKSWRLRGLVRRGDKNPRMVVNQLYLGILSRYPTKQEAAVAGEYFSGSGLDAEEAVKDLSWALINTKEFLYRH